MPSEDSSPHWMPILSAAIPLIILPITVLVLPLSAAHEMGLSSRQITNWILALYGVPTILGLLLSSRYRQPLLTTGNLFAIIFIISLGNKFSMAEIIGAFLITGVGVLLVSALGLTGRLAAWIPAPVVLGLLAGAIMPFFSGIFTAVGEAPLSVGGAFVAYMLSRRFLGARLPPIFPALIVGLGLALLSGQTGQIPTNLALPVPEITLPEFSLPAILTITPVLIVVITIQSNLPSAIFLRTQGYHPPERVIDITSGVGTILGSLLGPTAISLSLPATSLAAGPEAGEPKWRYQTVIISGVVVLLIPLLAGAAAQLPEIVPLSLLRALAGMALIDVFIRALQGITRGPLLLGAVFAFAIALSDITLFGFGRFFWSLAAGTGITYLLERKALKELRQGEAN